MPVINESFRRTFMRGRRKNEREGRGKNDTKETKLSEKHFGWLLSGLMVVGSMEGRKIYGNL